MKWTILRPINLQTSIEHRLLTNRRNTHPLWILWPELSTIRRIQLQEEEVSTTVKAIQD